MRAIGIRRRRQVAVRELVFIEEQHRIVGPPLSLIHPLIAQVLRYGLKLDLLDHVNRRTIEAFVNEFLELLLEAIKCHDHTGNVVHGPSQRRGPEYAINAVATVFVGLF